MSFNIHRQRTIAVTEWPHCQNQVAFFIRESLAGAIECLLYKHSCALVVQIAVQFFKQCELHQIDLH